MTHEIDYRELRRVIALDPAKRDGLVDVLRSIVNSLDGKSRDKAKAKVAGLCGPGPFRSRPDYLSQVLSYLDDRVSVDLSMISVSRVLYDDYSSWCEGQGTPNMGRKRFGSYLNDLGYSTFKSGNVTYKAGLVLNGGAGAKVWKLAQTPRKKPSE